MVELGLFAADGSSLGEFQLQVEPFASVQVNNVFSRKGLDDVSDAFAVVSSATDGAAFFAYASVVDNGTNDPIFVPGR